MSSEILADIFRDFRGYTIVTAAEDIEPFDGLVRDIFEAVDPRHPDRKVRVVYSFKFRKDTIAELESRATPDTHMVVVGGMATNTPLWTDPSLASLCEKVARLETIPMKLLETNIMTYFLMPKFSRITEAELEDMVRPDQLPTRKESDPPIRLLGFVSGDIVRIDEACEILGRRYTDVLISQQADCV